MMKIPVEQMFYVKMIDFGFVWYLYLISLDLQQMEEIKNIYIHKNNRKFVSWAIRCHFILAYQNPYGSGFIGHQTPFSITSSSLWGRNRALLKCITTLITHCV